MNMENNNLNKITKLEEKVRHLATREDMMKAHETINDSIQDLTFSINKLINEFGILTEKTNEVRKIAERAEKLADMADKRSKENGTAIKALIARLDLHIQKHKEQVREDIELSIFRSSRTRKVFIFAIFVGLYLFTIKEIRDVILGIIFKPFE